MTDTLTLQDCITALGSTLYQLDDMSQEDICDLAGQLADLSDLVAAVADGRDVFVDMMLRMDASFARSTKSLARTDKSRTRADVMCP